MPSDGTPESGRRHPRRLAGVPPALWLLAAATIAAALYAAWPVSAVRLEARGGVVKTVAVPRGAELYLDYQHSVARSPVREVFTMVDGGGFLLIRTEHGAFGAGLPSESFGEFRHEGDVFVISGINRPMQDIHLRVSAGSQQRLTVQHGSEIVFLDLFPANNTVIISARTVPRVRSILG